MKAAILIFLVIFFGSCSKPVADLVCYNGKVYTLDSSFSIVQAFAVKDGKIIATGSDQEMEKYRSAQRIDLEGKSVYPGFIDAHCHFFGYGTDLPKIWIGGTKSFSAILDSVRLHRDKQFMGWIFARGWDQNDWLIKDFPDRTELDKLFPDIPVILLRIDGHAALVNAKALEIAGISLSTQVNGGEIGRENNRLTGLLIDNAVDLVLHKIPTPGLDQQAKALTDAQRNCFAVGLTTVDDAGLDYQVINLIDSLQQTGKLQMRIYAMVIYTPANVAYYRQHGMQSTPSLTVRSFKLYGDGALGSRGACMKQPYDDKPGHYGFLLHPVDTLRAAAREARSLGFQLNTHCIGDSASALMLKIYAEFMNGDKTLRWRIEHAQVTDTADRKYYSENKIIPSMQPTHATSDMDWAGSRIGAERLKGAYSLHSLMKAAGLIACGSDFPVESINPLYGFYAAVSRMDQQGNPAGGFIMDEALTRVEALRGMCNWAAYANFEEGVKGSIEKDRFADFVILDTDLMTAPVNQLFNAKVLQTFVGGNRVYFKQ